MVKSSTGRGPFVRTGVAHYRALLILLSTLVMGIRA